MRSLFLGAAVLLAVATFWWSRPVERSTPMEGVEPTGDLGLPPEAAAAEIARPASGGAIVAGRTNATTSLPPIDRQGQLEVRMRAPVDVALSTPQVFTLSQRQVREYSFPTRTGRRQRAEPMSWDVALAAGTELSVFSDWSSEDGVTAGCSAWIKNPKRGSRVYARLDDRIGMAVVRAAGMGSVEVDFSKPRHWLRRVQVVYADGLPAEGVTVVGSVARETLESSSFQTSKGHASRTDEGGWVEMTLAAMTFPAARVYGLRPVEAEPHDADRIVLPPVGSIEVTLEGELAKLPSHLTVTQVGSPEGASARLRGGHGTVHPVALERRFRISLNDDMIGNAEVEVDGPLVAGEVVQATMSLAPTPTVKVRLVDDTGAPLSETAVSLSSSQVMYQFYRAVTDVEGHATFQVRSDPSFVIESSVKIVEYYREGSSSIESRHRRRAGEVLVSTAFVDGVLDLGTVTLRPPSVLVSGKVVNGKGEPVDGATVRRYRGGMEMGSKRTNESGTFTFISDGNVTREAESELELTAEGSGSRTVQPAVFRPGDRDVVLVLEEPGKIRIDATSLNVEELTGITLTLRPAEAAATVRAITVLPGQLTTLEGQQAGRYIFEVEMFPETAVLADDLHVKPGETLVDPRLNPLALDAAVQWRTLYVAGSDDALIQEITVGRVRSESVERATTVAQRFGSFRVTAYLRTAPDSYWVEAPGYLRQELDTLTDGMRIELQIAAEFTLQLEGAPLPSHSFTLQVAPQGSRTVGARPLGVTFDATGRATFPAAAAGTYVLNSPIASRRDAAAPTASEPWWGATFTIPKTGEHSEIPVRASAPSIR